MLVAVGVSGCSDNGEALAPGGDPDTGLDTGTASMTRDAAASDDAGPADAGGLPDAGPADSGAADSGSNAGGRTDIATLPLGTITLGADGRSGPLNFDLPAGTVSFTISAFGAIEATTIVRTLSGPTGVLVSDDDSGLSPLERFLFGPFGAQFISPNRVVQDRGAMAAIFPNNPTVSVAAGQYTFELEALRVEGNSASPYSGPVDVVVHYRTSPAIRGRLDVSLYFSGAGNVTAASAPSDPFIQDALQAVRTIYQQANISIGAVSYYDIDPSYRTISGVVDGSSAQLEEMFTLSANRGPGLHFFFVDRFEGGLGGNIAGVAGGLPGAPLAPGSLGAGVAVSIAAAGNDSGVLGHVMAHEGGHWLGLFHTVELIGSADQMPDTPEGQASDPFLMFPAVGGGTQVSANQATVMRHHIEVVAE